MISARALNQGAPPHARELVYTAGRPLLEIAVLGPRKSHHHARVYAYLCAKNACAAVGLVVLVLLCVDEFLKLAQHRLEEFVVHTEP